MDFNTVIPSQRAASIYSEYCSIFKFRLGMEREECETIGRYGKGLFAAEYAEHGDKAYATSVVLPLRNAYYSQCVVDKRWEFLSKLKIEEPVMDYGCGVGFMLLWLNRIGYTRLYGHEVEGVQRKLACDVFKPHGIALWTPGERVETVLCFNVLEHLLDPVYTLMQLKSISNRVIANVCMDEDDEPHIAPISERKKCHDMLTEWGTLYG